MATCSVITLGNTICSRIAHAEHNGICTYHRNIQLRKEEAAGPLEEGKCNFILSKRGAGRCKKDQAPNALNGPGYCSYHRKIAQNRVDSDTAIRAMIVQRQEEMRVVEGAILTEMVALWANSDENVANVLTEITGRAFARTITWPSRNRLRHAFTLVVLESKEPAMRGAFGHFIHQLDTVIVNRMLADRRRAEHQDRMRRLQTLGGIAGDRQNIHTAVVSTQTNQGLKVLFEQVVPADQATLFEIVTAWRELNVAALPEIQSVLQDMAEWYGRDMCRTEGDFLYQRVLDHLWSLILHSEENTELVKRLYQECFEAKGMCCDGHINRLVNVMVGFHDAFNPPLSPKEILQNKMSAIAMRDGPLDDKIKEAMEVFDEVKLPEEERQVWLESLA
jgi:hypothetical protein